MNIRSRRIIYLTFIFIFLIVTPVIILYAAGYRYNFQKNKIQKTGILILKSKPEGAQIFLNNKSKKNVTPARIGNLLPGDYLVRVERDGFYSWQKTLPVESRLTTFAENILLMKKTLPMKITDGQIGVFSLSPTKQKIVYLEAKETGNEIWLLNLRTLEKKMLYRLSGQDGNKINLEWSHDGQKILIASSDNNSKNSKFIVLDSENEEASIYQKLNDFYLSFRAINSQKIDASELDRLKLIDSPPNLFTAIDKKENTLTVKDAGSEKIFLEEKADFAAWTADGKKLLYLNNFEIWIYDLNLNQTKFISRYSREIKRALWINNNYLAILIDNTIKIIELDERDQRNIVDLATLEEINDFDVDQNKQSIYFAATLGNKKGVYELQY